jgi:hypothetical protein
VSGRILSLAVAWLVIPAALALGQQTPAVSPLPAATLSQADCTGFISASGVPADITVLNGEDNDLESSIRQYAVGNSIYLCSRRGARFSVGQQFSLVRPAKELFRTTRYDGERWTLRKLGKPYDDAGRVQVTHVTPQGAVAEVRFACGPIYPGDIAVPYRPRVVPDYVPTELARFALPNGKMQGAIVAARSNFASLANGDIVYLDLGEKKGAKAGQLYRVYYCPPRPGHWTIIAQPLIPRETVAELVVLSAQEKSAVGIIVNSKRDVYVGYGVELE